MEKKIKEQFEEEIKFWKNKIVYEAKNKGVSIGVLETIYKGSIIGFFGGWALGFFEGIICPFCPIVGLPIYLTGWGISFTSGIVGSITQSLYKA